MLKLTIIGAGPGGYTTAFAAARAGCQVTLIEKKHLGGTCLNTGCIPTKTLKATADALETANTLASFGVKLTSKNEDCEAVACVDMASTLARKDKVRDILVGGLAKTCARLKITHHVGTGRIINAHQVEVNTENETLMVESDAIIIATGSGIRELPTLPFDGTHIIHSDHILERENLPAKMIIVGGGVIGCEMAFIYQSFGVQITLIEGQKRLLPIPGVDSAISSLIQKEMKKRRINVHLGSTLSHARVENNTVHGQIEPLVLAGETAPANAKITAIESDAVLVTVGRTPYTQGLGLDDAGIATDAHGWIVVDEHLRTNIPGIYAIGDVLGPNAIMLAHMAAAEGTHALRHILAQKENHAQDMDPMNYDVVPSAIFTSPEVGCVGLSEEQAQELAAEKSWDVASATFQMRELGKAQASGHLAGLIKLVYDKNSGRLLGAHIAGEHASDLIAETALCLQMGGSVQDIANTIHAHPTMAEGIFELAQELYMPKF